MSGLEVLGAVSAVAGLVQVAGETTKLLYDFILSVKDAPRLAATIVAETEALSGIFEQLHKLLLGQIQMRTGRAEKLYVDKVLITVSDCVYTFSDLECELAFIGYSNKTDFENRSFSQRTWDKLKWTLKEETFQKILRDLQRQKTSILLMLTISNCESDFDAEKSSEALHNVIQEVLATNRVLSKKMDDMEKRLAGQDYFIRPAQSSIPSRNPSISIASSQAVSNSKRDTISRDSISYTSYAFEPTLYRTGVYLRTQGRGTLDRSYSSSIITGESARTQLSNISLAQLSNISVLGLPLCMDELFNIEYYKPNAVDPIAHTDQEFSDTASMLSTSTSIYTAKGSSSTESLYALNATPRTILQEERQPGNSSMVTLGLLTPPLTPPSDPCKAESTRVYSQYSPTNDINIFLNSGKPVVYRQGSSGNCIESFAFTLPEEFGHLCSHILSEARVRHRLPNPFDMSLTTLRQLGRYLGGGFDIDVPGEQNRSRLPDLCYHWDLVTIFGTTKLYYDTLDDNENVVAKARQWITSHADDLDVLVYLLNILRVVLPSRRDLMGLLENLDRIYGPLQEFVICLEYLIQLAPSFLDLLPPTSKSAFQEIGSDSKLEDSALFHGLLTGNHRTMFLDSEYICSTFNRRHIIYHTSKQSRDVKDKDDPIEHATRSPPRGVTKSRSFWKLKSLRSRSKISATAPSNCESVPEDLISPPLSAPPSSAPPSSVPSPTTPPPSMPPPSAPSPSTIEPAVSALHVPFSPPLASMSPLSNNSLASTISRTNTPATLVMYKPEGRLSYIEENWPFWGDIWPSSAGQENDEVSSLDTEKGEAAAAGLQNEEGLSRVKDEEAAVTPLTDLIARN